MKKAKIYITILALLGCKLDAQSVSFSFGSDTWDYATGPSTVGFVKQTASNTSVSSSGSITKNGITVKFGASFFGGATSGDNYSGLQSGSSLTFAPAGQNPAGFLLTTKNNDSTALPDGTSVALSGSADKYQRWHFEFSSPITINSFLIQDIDNLNGSFRDILGAEGYTPAGYSSAFSGSALNVASLPVAGSGIDPTFGLTLDTQLAPYSLSIGSETLSSLSPNVNTNNPNSAPKNSANVAFGDTEIIAFSIYALSNNTINHRMSLDSGVFQVTIPEPSSCMLLALRLAGFVLARRRA